MFNDDLKRRVRDATNLLDLVQSAVGKLARSGRNYKACCPFHNEKTPSFYVNPDAQFFKCYGCGKGGDVFTFVMLHERVEFVDALKLLADRAGIPFESDPKAAVAHQQDKVWKSFLYKLNEAAAKFFREQLHAPAGKEALAYLAKRGLNEEICERFGLGYAPSDNSPLLERLTKQKAPPKAVVAAGLATQTETGRVRDFFFHRLMFPIRDQQGRVIAFGGRVLGDGEPKYLNTRDTPLFRKSKTVYGIDLAREKINAARKAILVEGYTDVMMCHQFGVENVVACLGTAITPEHIRELRRHADELVMLTDSDKAGARASENSLAVLFAQEMPAKIARLPGSDKDPCDFLLSKGRELFVEALDHSSELFDFKFERTLQAHDIRTPLGLKGAADEMMRLASLVPDALLRNEFRRRVSAKLNIAEKELKFEAPRPVQQVAPEPGAHDDESGALDSGMTPPPETPLARSERDLLQFLFHEPAFIEDAMRGGELMAFSGKYEKAVAHALLMALSEGKLPPEPSLLVEGNASSLVAREAMTMFYAMAEAGVDVPPGTEQVCVDLAGQLQHSSGKLDKTARFEMLLKPLKMSVVQEKVSTAKREIAHCRTKGDSEGEERAYENLAAALKALSQLKASGGN